MAGASKARKAEVLAAIQSLGPATDEAAFVAFAAERCEQVLSVLRTKGEQYADNSRPEPAWANYEEMGAFAHRTTPEEMVHAMLKHLWVIMRYAQGSNHTKDIQERISDVFVYLLLLAFWILHHPD